MYIIEVIPIARGIPKETLTYFSTLPCDVGSLIEVTIKNRPLPALVTEVTNATNMKGDIKSAPFPMRRAGRVLVRQFISPAFLEASRETAHYYVGSTGTVLRSLIPAIAFQTATQNDSPEMATKHTIVTPTTAPDKLALQAGEEERFAHYKSLIRSEFAKHRSVFMCLPTIEEAKRASHILEKGIESYTILLHSGLSKKSLSLAWNRGRTETHPVLIIGTGSFLSISRTDIGALIIERESSPAYKLYTKPYLDVRFFAERLATHLHATPVFGDILLRIETAERVRRGDIAELAPLKWRTLFSAPLSIVDMRPPLVVSSPTQQPKKKVPFRTLGDEVAKLIQRTHDESAHLFLFAARKGLAPTTVCDDCGTTVICTNCSAPVTLHLGDPADSAGNVFVCNQCGQKRPASERCTNCTGWRLSPLGIGIDKVAQEIRERFPEVTLFQIDKKSVSTSAMAQKIAREFRDTPGSILLGTELALLYLESSVEYSGIVSIDSLLTIPDFRIHEKILSILVRLRSQTSGTMILQTRCHDAHVFEHARTGSLVDFFREETEMRKQLNYPPFALLIKISIEGQRDAIYETMTQLKTYLATSRETKQHFDLEIFPAFIHTVRNKFVLHGLIRLSPKEWPGSPLRTTLASLPPEFSIRIDPESLL
jgi:primosomal protein N' (replication factor Y)